MASHGARRGDGARARPGGRAVPAARVVGAHDVRVARVRHARCTRRYVAAGRAGDHHQRLCARAVPHRRRAVRRRRPPPRRARRPPRPRGRRPPPRRAGRRLPAAGDGLVPARPVHGRCGPPARRGAGGGAGAVRRRVAGRDPVVDRRGRARAGRARCHRRDPAAVVLVHTRRRTRRRRPGDAALRRVGHRRRSWLPCDSVPR